jgi:hypothetical protein
MGAFVRRPCLPCAERNTSSRVPWLRRHVPAFVATPDPSATVSPSIAFPGAPVIRSTWLHRFRDGARTVSPVAWHALCHRAVPTTPPKWPTASVRLPPVMLPSPRTKGLGLRSLYFSRPLVGSLALRPGDSLTIPRMALSVGFIRFVSSADATQATGGLTLPPVGLPPTEHASLSWTHCSAIFPSGRLSSAITPSGGTTG